MNSLVILGLIALYFAILFTVSFFTKGKADNSTFFSANRNSKWYLVAFGMIGTSLSGVTFISVPGQVALKSFSYFQVVLGYIVGYTVIATVLMPLYYRLNLVSIYSYLEERFGRYSYKTGAWIFLVSRTLGSAARFFLVLGVLHNAVFAQWGVPFWVSVIIGLLLIWVYTFQGGIKTIIITDTLQTACMLLCLVLSLYLIADSLNLGLGDLFGKVMNGPKGQIFFLDDWRSPGHFVKQFLSGIFIAIVMTGLDQDMMQKNLTVPNIKQAQLNMFSFTAILVLVNFLFLVLGSALYLFAETKGIAIPEKTDSFFPMVALQHLPLAAGLIFVMGIIAATYASTDSALTALTTSFCVDVLGMKKDHESKTADAMRHRVHLGMTFVMFLVVLVFHYAKGPDLLTIVFTLAGYTYGPMLGMFAFGIFTNRKVNDGAVPFIALASPLLCYAADYLTKLDPEGYRFGFELLLLNGALTFGGMWAVSKTGKVGESGA